MESTPVTSKTSSRLLPTFSCVHPTPLYRPRQLLACQAPSARFHFPGFGADEFWLLSLSTIILRFVPVPPGISSPSALSRRVHTPRPVDSLAGRWRSLALSWVFGHPRRSPVGTTRKSGCSHALRVCGKSSGCRGTDSHRRGASKAKNLQLLRKVGASFASPLALRGMSGCPTFSSTLGIVGL